MFSNIFQGRKKTGCYAIFYIQEIENKLKCMLKTKLSASLLLGLGGQGNDKPIWLVKTNKEKKWKTKMNDTK